MTHNILKIYFIVFLYSVNIINAEGIDVESLDFTNSLIKVTTTILIITLAPSLLISTTCFTRILIVLGFLRSGLGTNQSPPNIILISISIFITIFVMRETFTKIYYTSIAPLNANQISSIEAIQTSMIEIKKFMINNTEKGNIVLFTDIAKTPIDEEPSFFTILPAFIISELNKAFKIGFMIFLPFIVIDIAVASVLMSMGIMMLPPVMISMPIKIIFFTAINGWQLIVQGLITAYN